MSVLSVESATESDKYLDLQNYVEARALPEGGYLVLEQEINAQIPFKFDLFPLLIEGVVDTNALSLTADIKVYVPIKGYVTVYHFSKSLKDGITIPIDLPLIKGSIIFKIEDWQGKKWFTLVIDVKFPIFPPISKTIHLFAIPLLGASNGVSVAGLTAGSTVSAADLNTQWLEQLHLFSKLALANGGALPVLPQVAAATGHIETEIAPL
ncbi:hypothetical protein SISNIDRAFT_467414 [Sistotremastrum niveocremeum HHB9708]|uniref:Uncharacterized protein n=1 Tax=Sistotremastrum niveocremeum HHB9708 TaxID=1314777 RepID=A0A164SUP8_9AGAM|nr:hypothetical protein SISNIDRAFT_467414 [Sistotremastrum niveocremeum HHB9708]